MINLDKRRPNDASIVYGIRFTLQMSVESAKIPNTLTRIEMCFGSEADRRPTSASIPKRYESINERACKCRFTFCPMRESFGTTATSA